MSSTLPILSLAKGLIVVIAALVPFHVTPSLASDKCENPATLRFSLIPAGNIEQRIRLYQPLFTRIEALTGRPLKIVRPGSYGSVAEGLLGGSIDIAAIGPAGYVDVSRKDPGIRPFATYEKNGGTFQTKGPYYHAVLATLSQGTIAGIESLKGTRLALTDPGSTSGSLLPREEFSPKIGMPLEKYFGAITFTGSHVKSIDALLGGIVDAAFIASTQLEEALQAGKLTARQIRVLWQSEPIPYDPFVWREQLCESIKKQIKAAFFDDPKSLHSLLDGLESARFVPIDDSHYANLRKVLEKPIK